MRILDAASHASVIAEPLWSSVPKAAGPAVTALVAVSLALAGCFRFLRFRIFKPRMALSVAAEVRLPGDKPALMIDVAIKNDGQCAVRVDPCFNHSLDIFLATTTCVQSPRRSAKATGTPTRSPAARGRDRVPTAGSCSQSTHQLNFPKVHAWPSWAAVANSCSSKAKRTAWICGCTSCSFRTGRSFRRAGAIR